MHPVLNAYLANALAADRIREAEQYRRSRIEWSEVPDTFDSVTVRVARPADADAILRLAERDGRHVPHEPLLVAEVRGQLLAARSLDGHGAIADPFSPTAHLVELLELRSAHLRDGTEPPHSGRGARGWLRTVFAAART
jgi:hypothetical protein